MRKFAVVTMAIALALGVSACAPDDGTATPTSQATPTPDQKLVPPVADDTITEVDPTVYDDGFGWISFKVGSGPVWCTITTETDRVLCEQNEASAMYEPIPAPEGCDGSYGYQVQLWANQPESGQIAEFACASGQFNDPTAMQILPSGSKITSGSITCYVKDLTARCDNLNGQWIALGPKTWSLNN